MIEQSGQVIAVEGDEAVVRTARQSSCGSCSNKSCGTGALSEIFADKAITLRVDNLINARPGDQVLLGISEAALVRGSLIIYLLPILALFFGAWFAELMAVQLHMQSELAAPLGGFLALALAFAWIRLTHQKHKNDARFRATLLRHAGNQAGVQTVHFN